MDKKEKQTYFFDTYAFVEMLKGNKNYEKYKGCKKITTILNLMELHLSILRDTNEKNARKVHNKLLKHTVPVYDKAIFDGNKLKLKAKGLGLSYVDCIGYAIARHHKIKFLTGDEGFRNIDGVEFVKKEGHINARDMYFL